MSDSVSKEVEKALERLFPVFLEKYSKVYSKEDLVTREEFLEAIKSINNRFEAVDRRFEQLIGQLAQQRKEFKDEMAQQRKEFKDEMEQQRKEFRQEFQRMDDRWTTMYREMIGIRKGLASLGDRAGHKTEKLILGFWQDLINERFGVDVQHVREVVIIKNVEGRTFEIQFDMFVDGDPPYIFEVKFHPSKEDIDHLIMKSVEYVKIKGSNPELVLLSQVLDPAVKRYAEKQGIHLMGPAEDPPEIWEE